MSPSDWLVEYRPGTCHHPRLGHLPGLPFRMRRRSQPGRAYVIDDRNAGEQFTQGDTEVELVTLWTALDLLAGTAAKDEEGPKAGSASIDDDGVLRSQAAVCDELCIGRTRLNALIRVLPPEEYGAARLISKPDATKKRRVWHEEVLEDWLEAAVEAEATTVEAPHQAEPQRSTRRQRRVRGQPKAASFKELVRRPEG